MAHKAVQRIIQLKANADGAIQVPDRIHLMTAGKWSTPFHGQFEMTADDLTAMVANYNSGVGLVAGSNRAPINYGHDQGGKAAGWINELTVEGDELWGSITWTPAGRKALEEGEYRYISPEWNPRDFPWENPQVEGELIENVFNGAALTNIPLFTNLKPVMASRDGSHGVRDNSIKANKGEDMDLSEVRVKELKDLTDEEKTFLVEHKDELTDEERTKFELVEAEAESEAETEVEADATEEEATDEAEVETKEEVEEEVVEEEAQAEEEADEATQVEASRKTVSISASQFAQLEADAKAGREARQLLARRDASEVMASAFKAGKVKQDQQDAGVELLLADRDGKFKAFIEALPANSLLASEQGSGAIETTVEITDTEKEYAQAFNLTTEEVAEYKKSKQESKE